jgi:hypothetical protein
MESAFYHETSTAQPSEPVRIDAVLRGMGLLPDTEDRLRRLAAVDELCAEARDLINEKWAHVEAVAKALYRHKTLSGNRVCEIIERVEREE